MIDLKRSIFRSLIFRLVCDELSEREKGARMDRAYQWIFSRVEEYFSRYNVPFGIAQYYRYKKKLADGGIDAIKDRRSRGNNRKLTEEAAGFLKGYMTSYPTAGFIAVLHT